MPNDAGGAQTYGERDKVSDETRVPGEFGVGSQVASYRLDEVLGRGGMAVVYRAFDTRLQRRVAMKILSPDLARDQEFRHRFIRESQAAAAVDHPNIIPIFEAGQFGSVLFIAMRFVEGRDVHSIIEQHGHLSVARTCSIVTQVAAALDAAHAHGLVHRDVKPANMLREPAEGSGQADHVYLSDFGLSKRSFASTGLTSKGHFLGTLNYIAPEQIEGKMVDGRADQYALACSAFEMLSGTPPFKRDETLAIMWAQISASPPAVTSMRPGLPGALDPVLARALAKAPAERYQTCLEFAAALRRACGLEAGPAVPQSAAPDHPRTRPVNLADLAAAAAAAPSASPPGAAGLPPPVAPPGAQPVGPPAAPLVPPAAAQPVPPGGIGAPPQADIPTVRPGGMGPPTQAATLPSLGGRAPGVGSPPWPTQPDYTEPPQPPSRSSRRTWIAVVIAGVVVVAAVGAYLVAGHGGGGGNKPPPVVVLPPPCTTKVAAAKALTSVPSKLATITGHPFDAVVTGGYGFVSLSPGLAIVNMAGPVPHLIRTLQIGSAQGEGLTRDQKYLLVTGGSGAQVFSVSSLEQGGSSPLGSLSSPGGKHGVEVALSPSNKYAFVTLQDSGQVAVFNLRQALTKGFGPSDLVRTIPVGREAIGIAASPDGKYLYVTSGLANPATASGKGSLVVLDMHKAETPSQRAIVQVVDGGCGPARVIASPDGKYVWMTAGGGNALLAYSAAKLIKDPAHALVARVAVGQTPLGLTMVNTGAGMRIVVADSNRDNVSNAVSNLAVIDVAKALAGKPALVGVIKSGTTPRQFVLEPGGKTLLVTNTGSGQIQTLKISRLP